MGRDIYLYKLFREVNMKKYLLTIILVFALASPAYSAWKTTSRVVKGETLYSYSDHFQITGKKIKKLFQLHDQIESRLGKLVGVTTNATKVKVEFRENLTIQKLNILRTLINSFQPAETKRESVRKKVKKNKLKKLKNIPEIRAAIIDLYDLNGIDYDETN